MLSIQTDFKNGGGALAQTPAPDFGDDEIPPVDSCALCGDSRCQGECLSKANAESALDSDGLLGRSLAVTLVPADQFGGKLPDRPWASLRFAFATEFLAIGSYAAPITATVLAWDGSHAERLATLRTSLVSVSLFTLLVVVLHLLWGASLELGLWLSGRRSDASLGMSLSGYTCGFDLLTSPLGVLWLLSKKDVRLGAVLRAAVGAPRPAMQAYLSHARNLDPSSIRAAERGAWVGFSLGIVALVVGAAYGSWWMIAREWGS